MRRSQACSRARERKATEGIGKQSGDEAAVLHGEVPQTMCIMPTLTCSETPLSKLKVRNDEMVFVCLFVFSPERLDMENGLEGEVKWIGRGSKNECRR